MDRNPYPLRDELLTEPIEMAADGYVYLPQKPGLGIELREDTIENTAWTRKRRPPVLRAGAVWEIAESVGISLNRQIKPRWGSIGLSVTRK